MALSSLAKTQASSTSSVPLSTTNAPPAPSMPSPPPLASLTAHSSALLSALTLNALCASARKGRRSLLVLASPPLTTTPSSLTPLICINGATTSISRP